VKYVNSLIGVTVLLVCVLFAAMILMVYCLICHLSLCLSENSLNQIFIWMIQVEHMLEAEDYGKDLATVQNLLKKHQLLEADVKAHDDRVSDLNNQADAFIDSGMWDTETIREKKQTINERYERSVFIYCCMGLFVCNDQNSY